MWIIDKERRKRILTTLNQAAGERFTFEYGCCSSEGGRVIKKKKEENPRNRGEERHCYSSPQGIEGYGK